MKVYSRVTFKKNKFILILFIYLVGSNSPIQQPKGQLMYGTLKILN